MSAEKIVIRVTEGIKVQIKKSNKPYVIIDKETGKVLEEGGSI